MTANEILDSELHICYLRFRNGYHIHDKKEGLVNLLPWDLAEMIEQERTKIINFKAETRWKVRFIRRELGLPVNEI